MYKLLSTMKRDDNDDGMMIGHQNRDEATNMEKDTEVIENKDE
jgi:hypothetical protein